MTTSVLPRKRLAPFLVLIVLLNFTATLHISRHESTAAEDAQLDYLIAMQENYKTKIINLSQRIRLVSQELDTTEDLDEQIKILQEAINDERKQIGQLSTETIPDPNAAEMECQILSKEEQESLVERAKTLSKEIADLESLALSVPYCDEIEAMKQQIQKMKANLKLIETTVSNNCEQHFIHEDAVFQTNLYNNTNWVLGAYTMDQLIDEYYERSMKYANISNCPLEAPYYASHFPTEGLGSCVACSNSEPVFDIEKKKCIACPFDFEINTTTHLCEPVPKNSNYTYGQNYVLAPLKLIPLPNPDLKSCPEDRPFFDGEVCVACELPSNYWQISEKICQSCEEETSFDINMRKCLISESNKLTELFGTKWITEDKTIKEVLNERLEILEENKTSGIYEYCPDLTPYFDGIACIYCPEETVFNLDTKLCTKTPEGLKYDENMRQFIEPLQNHETDPEAENYISREPLKDNSLIPNCNQSHPYYDSIACIKCEQPFIIYDVDGLRCSLCDPIQIYNATTHQCDLRKYIYVKGSQQKLMATPQVSIEDYRQMLKDTVIENPDAFPMQCQEPTYYAGIEDCHACSLQKNQYFNVEKLECEVCDGTVDAVTRVCHERTYYFTNLDAENILLPSTLTIQQAKSEVKEALASDNQNKECPIGRPIPIDDRNDCSVCPEETPIFNYTSKTCTSCAQGEQYDQRDYLCKETQYLTDLQSNVLIEQPLTMNELINKETEMNKTQMTERCPPEKPYTYDHSFCFDCTDPSPIFNATSGVCTVCPSPLVFDAVKHICKKVHYLTDLNAEGLLEQENAIIPNVRTEQERIKSDSSLNYEECPPEKPYGQITGCVDCIEDQTYFNLKTLSCEACPEKTGYWAQTHSCIEITTFSNLDAPETKYVQDENNKIETLRQQIQATGSKGPIEFCPEDKPYFGTDEDNATKHCLNCPEENPYFILADVACGSCDNYHPENQSCPPKPFHYPNLTNFHWITTTGNADKVINDGLEQRKVEKATECPAFYNSQARDCIECPEETFFNYQTYECQTCPEGTVFDINIHICVVKEEEGRFYTKIGTESEFQLYGGLTLGELEGTQAQMKQKYPDSHYCPEDKPYYDGIQCIKCPEYKIYFNLRYNLCQVCMFDETLDTEGHNCLDQNGTPVWRKPEGKLVYPYLFGPRE